MKKPNTLDLIRKGVEALQAENISIIAGIINAFPTTILRVSGRTISS